LAPTRILLADDNDEVLREIREELQEEFEIIGTVSNGQDAVDAVIGCDPDVLVLDITMPVLNGLQVAAIVREKRPGTKTLFLTIHEQPEYISAAFSAGASGYVTKRRLCAELAHAVREVAQGNTFISSTLQR
jgi:DNA-binding NarL/FixJ family response regulator